jgi:organic hydroperoxide reductase OsmC/OhrA
MASIVPIEATAIGGRTGWVGSSNGALRLRLTADPKGVSPEALMASTLATSFVDVLRHLAPNFGHILVDEANVTARVRANLEPTDPGPPLQVTLFVDLADVPTDVTYDLAMAARSVCPYARALDLAQSLEIQVT